MKLNFKYKKTIINKKKKKFKTKKPFKIWFCESQNDKCAKLKQQIDKTKHEIDLHRYVKRQQRCHSRQISRGNDAHQRHHHSAHFDRPRETFRHQLPFASFARHRPDNASIRHNGCNKLS